MQTKYKLPADAKQTVLGYIRGYKRRVSWYLRERDDIAQSVYVPHPERGENGTLAFMPGSGTPGDPTALKAMRLEALERHPNVQAMRAIEQARLRIGEDIKDDTIRSRMAESIWESCIKGRDFVFEYKNLPMGKTCFYKHRQKFIYEIAKQLNII